MTVLETSIRNLANALDALETRLERHLTDESQAEERDLAVTRQSRAARAQIETASTEVAALINEVQSILDATPEHGDN